MAHFQPGQSGNPGGRPKADGKLKEAARTHTEAALQVLVDALSHTDGRIALKAAELLLDRGYGKPAQTIAGDPENPLVFEKIVRQIVRPDNPHG
jgi:hypothetical protein